MKPLNSTLLITTLARGHERSVSIAHLADILPVLVLASITSLSIISLIILSVF